MQVQRVQRLPRRVSRCRRARTPQDAEDRGAQCPSTGLHCDRVTESLFWPLAVLGLHLDTALGPSTPWLEPMSSEQAQEQHAEDRIQGRATPAAQLPRCLPTGTPSEQCPASDNRRATDCQDPRVSSQAWLVCWRRASQRSGDGDEGRGTGCVTVRPAPAAPVPDRPPAGGRWPVTWKLPAARGGGLTPR